MRQSFVVTVLLAVVLGLIVANCSSPLDSNTFPQPSPPVVVTITDTVVDTLIQTETDTLVDTVTVIVPDTSQCVEVCNKLEKYQKKLTWYLTNTSGDYRIALTVHRYDGSQDMDLVVKINGVEHPWHAKNHETFESEQYLSSNAVISVERSSKCWDYTAKFCIAVSPIE